MKVNDYTVIDIETIFDESMVERLPEPEIKYGNTKDEEKREIIRQKAKNKQVEKMALNPLYGRICSVVTMKGDNVNYKTECVDSDWKEIEIIEFIKSQAMNMSLSPKICTWNGINFDIPFIYKRALILGVSIDVPMSYWIKKYSYIPHCDLMQLWCNWYGYEKLDTVSNIILNERKTEFDVSTIKDLMKTTEGRNIITEYNLTDVKLTKGILKKSINILF